VCPLLLTPSPLASGFDGIVVQELESGAVVVKPHERCRRCFWTVAGAVVVVIDRHLWRRTVGTEPLAGPDDGGGRQAVASRSFAGMVTNVATVFEYEKRFDVSFVLWVVRHGVLVVAVVVAPPLAVHDSLAVELDVVARTDVHGRGGGVGLLGRVFFVGEHWLAGRSQEVDPGVLGQVDFTVRAVRAEPTRPFPRPLGRGSRRVHRYVVVRVVPVQL